MEKLTPTTLWILLLANPFPQASPSASEDSNVRILLSVA